MSTAGIEFIRNEMDWDKYDPWGCVKAAQFDLCEAWWVAMGLCLEGYRPSSVVPFEFTSERAERLCNAIECAIVRFDDVQYWLKVLTRMCELVVLAGRDY